MSREDFRVVRASEDCPAILFLNSNKSEQNIHRIVAQAREKCQSAGIALKHEVIVNKGPDRDIDRDAVNMLIAQLVTGRYDAVVVNTLSDLTQDSSDLQEFMSDAAAVGIGFFELSSMRFYMAVVGEQKKAVWKVGEGH